MAETVGTRRFLGQSAAYRGEDAPRNQEDNDDEEYSLHDSPTANDTGGRG
jgi:hypothetical protein